MARDIAGELADDAGSGDQIELQAWREFCRRLEAVGEELLSAPFPVPEADRVEGFAHLADQVLCWLGWSLEHSDPAQPFFMRQNDLVTQWGGPSADNVYRHARIDSHRRYRIRGRMHSAEDFILALRAGFMHQQHWGTLAEYTASDLGIRAGDVFEIELGGSARSGEVRIDADGVIHLPLPQGAVMASIREYYFDWSSDEPAMFTIECLDPSGDAVRVTATQLVERFDEAAAGVEHSMRYWNQYMIDERAARVDNTFAGSLILEKGLAAARYAFCFWDLADDEALVIDTDLPLARYWSFQLYVPGWFETVDPVTRITSRNHMQAEVREANRVQMVVSSVDPGVVNWLDTGGRPQGLCTLRWFWPDVDQEPTPTARVVKLGEVQGELDPGARLMSPGERRAELAARRSHLAWRFRV
jgi:hypothetical protein